MSSESLQQAFHYLYPNEVPALKYLAQQLGSNPLVINIGAGAGTSGLAFMESRLDLQLVTIDIQKEDSPFGCLYAEEVELKKAGLWGDRNRQIHMDSKECGRSWFDEQPDMVFIDGEHSYEGCKGDILAWLPEIKKGGIIAIHDYRKGDLAATPDGPHPKPWPGVDQAVQELLVGKLTMLLHVDSLIAFEVEK
jgi:predicted O-methyltransferase YrrM